MRFIFTSTVPKLCHLPRLVLVRCFKDPLKASPSLLAYKFGFETPVVLQTT